MIHIAHPHAVCARAVCVVCAVVLISGQDPRMRTERGRAAMLAESKEHAMKHKVKEAEMAINKFSQLFTVGN